MRSGPKELLRFWFTFEEPVDRGAYLRHGAALMVVKYGVDAALVVLGAGTLWTPLDYLASAPFLLVSRFSSAAPFLAPTLVVWTLPFLWIGVCMTIRRLLDAGWSAWWALLFFVPVLNYALLLVLALAPTSERQPGSTERPEPSADRLPSALLSMALGALVGVGMVAFAVYGVESYGLSLFMGTPFVIGLITAFTLCRRYPASNGETLEVVVMTMFLVAGASLVVGIEGAVCLLMAAPLGLVLAAMGGIIGRYLASVGEGPARGAALLLILVPGTATVESGPNAATLREVRTAVVVDGTPAEVWDEVIAFSPIPEDDRPLLFRLGLAYPLRAEIRGAGVGAVRYCVFSTGSFVEPITAWEPGRRLAFDVRESPRPLEELSFRDVTAPHLEGYLLPRAGEFRMVRLDDGRTRLKGSTWYEQKLRPEGYWVLFSDHVIGRIHRRVLEHIRTRVEAAATGDRPPPGFRHPTRPASYVPPGSRHQNGDPAT